jgi:signal transduction histidine kinase
MHGTIAVDSQIDKGTTFTLTFPNAESAGQGYQS